MNSSELRNTFLKFFEDKGHTIVPSSSLIPHDPSVLFTIAGMIPFKPFFTGEEKPTFKRATSVQKCFRTVDIDIIGTTERHVTFFEMLGNFSFGDYFKDEAINFAWEFITDRLGIGKDRLWITVHDSDEESFDIWTKKVGLDPLRVQYMGDDNFWQMGSTGPCGPCSEIYYDKGPDYGDEGGPKFGGAERFVEIWNLVFMQFERSMDGSLSPLPKPSIDTGAGLERILPILQDVDSIFSTDVLKPIVETAERLTKTKFGANKTTDSYLKVLADHGRSMTFLVSDGVFPTNEGRGYVLRRIIRRAIKRAWQLGVDSNVTDALVDSVVDTMKSGYPKLVENIEYIKKVLRREEETFRDTLKIGSEILDEALSSNMSVLPGEIAFKLHDTFGFPIELTAELASEKGIEVDIDGFKVLMEDQRELARRSSSKGANLKDLQLNEKLQSVADIFGLTEFVGYELTENQARVLAIVEVSSVGRNSEKRSGDESETNKVKQVKDGVVKETPQVRLVVAVDKTCFYAEGGGQVGDSGIIEVNNNIIRVLDTKPTPQGITLHYVDTSAKDLINVGDEIVLRVDKDKRDSIRRNHTGTHLLHYALRKVLGDHVRQQGSLVEPERLRFDFSHFSPLSKEEIANVELVVMNEILRNELVVTQIKGKEDAEKEGAIAFFGDKYGDTVRVVYAGKSSVEFCGGTHVSGLGMIGCIVIISESSIGSNTRRIEALTGLEAFNYLMQKAKDIDHIASTLKSSPGEAVEAVERLKASYKKAEDELKSYQEKGLKNLAKELESNQVSGRVIERVDSISADEMRSLASSINKKDHINVVALIGKTEDGKVAFVISSSDKDVDASSTVKKYGSMIQGGGGGNAQLAVAGGKNVSAIDDVLISLRSLLIN